MTKMTTGELYRLLEGQVPLSTLYRWKVEAGIRRRPGIKRDYMANVKVEEPVSEKIFRTKVLKKEENVAVYDSSLAKEIKKVQPNKSFEEVFFRYNGTIPIRTLKKWKAELSEKFMTKRGLSELINYLRIHVLSINNFCNKNNSHNMKTEAISPKYNNTRERSEYEKALACELLKQNKGISEVQRMLNNAIPASTLQNWKRDIDAGQEPLDKRPRPQPSINEVMVKLMRKIPPTQMYKLLDGTVGLHTLYKWQKKGGPSNIKKEAETPKHSKSLCVKKEIETPRKPLCVKKEAGTPKSSKPLSVKKKVETPKRPSCVKKETGTPKNSKPLNVQKKAKTPERSKASCVKKEPETIEVKEEIIYDDELIAEVKQALGTKNIEEVFLLYNGTIPLETLAKWKEPAASEKKGKKRKQCESDGTLGNIKTECNGGKEVKLENENAVKRVKKKKGKVNKQSITRECVSVESMWDNVSI
eukprot:TRINITY_DN1410_c0_g1_i1.p1 TRINITY_DN1410_c0_g1~~TRINITY_DN1410_c0_g1_i1.p1  ORF type:complete len:472 (+),score=69.11 TRINITY_DN1410_c0_g1_i1:438-1853(+)